MSAVPESVAALISSPRDGQRNVAPGTVHRDDLGDGNVTVRVEWSSVNYKDGLATLPKGKVARIDPLVPGVDLAGEVVDSDADGVAVGDKVIVHGHDLGVGHHGGFAEYARVPSDWVVELPLGLTTREAMALGTAGFTAAASIDALEDRGFGPDDGPVLVTGATGGVGSTAVAMLGRYGFHVVASTGKPEAAGWLRDLGAREIISRDEVIGDPSRPLGKPRWAAAVDCVGGESLAGVIRQLERGGAVAASGNTGGANLEMTVFPFILRGVALLGVDSVGCPGDYRRKIWHRMAGDLKPPLLSDSIAHEIDGIGSALVDAIDTVLAGGMKGRNVVRIGA